MTIFFDKTMIKRHIVADKFTFVIANNFYGGTAPLFEWNSPRHVSITKLKQPNFMPADVKARCFAVDS